MESNISFEIVAKSNVNKETTLKLMLEPTTSLPQTLEHTPSHHHRPNWKYLIRETSLLENVVFTKLNPTLTERKERKT